ncbi:MerR family transcriptional regulator [Streptomyces sp. NPDC050400]|uniref:MerR family transcriptional regulator n=1 Tax=Streptomyces sp. NPDC050400 TaxID=3365610 RepID=UPI00379668B8
MKSSGDNGDDGDDDGATTMSIGALASRFGLATHVLRHWESMGLLHPERDAAGRRRYTGSDLTRVATILVFKEAGLDLDTIRTLSTTAADRATRHEILRAEADELRSRIAAAQTSLELIEGGLTCTHEDVTECPNYRRLIAERIGTRTPGEATPQPKAPFWGEGSYGVQDPLTDAAVEEAEQHLGVRLPSSLLEILRLRNGGPVDPARDAFPTTVPTSWSESHVPLDGLMGIGRREGHLSLLDTPYLVEEWGLPSPLVLLSGDGHCWIALDYRLCGRHGEPSVTWFDTDRDTELALAPDFTTFVGGLTSAAAFEAG